MTVSLLTDFFLPLGGSLFLWFLLVPTIMLCRYCSSLYNNAWHLSLAKSTGQCCVVFLCAKQMENKTTLTRRCSMWCDVFLHAPLEFAGVSLPLPRSICVCTSVCQGTEGQQCTQMDKWAVQKSSRCLKWPLLSSFIEPLASNTKAEAAPGIKYTCLCLNARGHYLKKNLFGGKTGQKWVI